ncbi:hypothetical protein A2765_03815 [Candidatus Kaiserbacteria bacterium RIFCSPHIGHO2_01_FULL_56_24]|uniref:Uncharacterized protein n=1 Tax=Candidatus Kaiserbacteria bacterium RIFCSPHIGHO2_01_FULL_56_24 TaxID=1798487 RepID=A0A1F6DHA2_9BACT|nr:MAG: hypothetical protein A2765_03815 [Candidatus Kaiserbacteria bacterium RIFCSPHIGHO2_01_FULL_56_24]
MPSLPLALSQRNWPDTPASPKRTVEEAWRPPEKSVGEEVAAVMAPKLLVKVKGSAPAAPVASVPQENVPLVEALTSQLAALRPETKSAVVEAVPETVMAVVDANGNVEARVEVAVKMLATIPE